MPHNKKIEDRLYEVPSQHNKETFKELWELYKWALASSQDILELYLCNDIVELITDFTTWKEILPGQLVDLKWADGSWWIGLVIASKQKNNGQNELLIRYYGWPSRWDEFVLFESGRIQPFGTHTGEVLTMSSSTKRTMFYNASTTTRNGMPNCGDIISYGNAIGKMVGYKNVIIPILADSSMSTSTSTSSDVSMEAEADTTADAKVDIDDDDADAKVVDTEDSSYDLHLMDVSIGTGINMVAHPSSFGVCDNLQNDEWACHCGQAMKKNKKNKSFDIITHWFCVKCGCSFKCDGSGCSLPNVSRLMEM